MSKNVGTIYYEIDADTGKLLNARSEADQSFDSIDRGARQADRGVRTLNTGLKMLAKTMMLIMASQAVKEFINMAETAAQLRVKIERLTGSASDAARVMDSLKRISNETGAGLSDTVSLWEGLAISLKNTSATEGQILNITSTLQKMGIVGGASAEAMGNSMRQFRQAIDGGILRGEEFNGILENTPTIIQGMARSMGLSMGQFRAAMLDGKITAEDMINSIQDLSDEVNKDFANTPRTTAQALNELKNEFITLAEEINNTLGITDHLITVIGLAKDGVKIFGDGVDFAKTCVIALRDAGSEFIDMFDDVGRKALEVAEDVLRLATPIMAVINAYKEMKGLLDKNSVKKDPLKFLGNGVVGKAFMLNEDMKAVLAGAEDPNKGKPDNGKITGFEPPVEKDKGGKGKGKGKKGGSRMSAEDRLAEQGKNYALSYVKDVGAMERYNQELKAIDAAFAKGSISYITYTEARKKSMQNFHDTIKQLKEEEQREGWNKLVSDEDRRLGEVDPIQQIQNEWTIRKAMLTDLGASQEAIRQQELAHEQQLLDLQWQRWAAQSETNRLVGDMVNSLGDGATNALTGLINGTQSLREAFANVGTTIINQVCGAIVQMGTDWVKQQILAAATAKSTQAAATADAVASAGAITAAATPAAAAMNTATMGGAASVGMTALSAIMSFASSLFGGKRYNGGSVMGGKMYRVGEGGKPELFQSGGKNYMIPGDGGRVVSNRAAFGGGGDINMPVSIQIYPQNGWSEQDTRKLEADMKRIALGVIREQATRPAGIIQPRK